VRSFDDVPVFQRSRLRQARDLVPRRLKVHGSSLLRVSCRLVATDLGGAAVDIDNERDYDVARLRYSEWIKAQREKAERLSGQLPLPPGEQNPRS